MPMKIDVNSRTIIAYLDGEIDHHSAAVIREEIDAAIEKNMPTCLILDFRDVSFMDSSGIGLVMGRYKALKKYDAELYITNTSPQITKVMKLSGIERLAKLDKGDR